MKAIHKQAVIIGGGPGGLAAAVELQKKGIRDLLILERERHLGGILRPVHSRWLRPCKVWRESVRAGIRPAVRGGSF